MSERVKHAIDYCQKNKQGHLKDYMTPVFTSKSDELAKQVLKTDFVQINRLFEEMTRNEDAAVHNTDLNQTGETGKDTLTPMQSFDLSKVSGEKKMDLTELGIESIRRGEVAAVTMAGGQGTRLGHHGPKGTFILHTKPPRSLFSIQCERLQEVREITGISIPWLIMTSEENHASTVEFFEQNNYFGYDPEKIGFFPQEMIPIIDFDGKVLVNENGISTGPNGNGGIFSSLIKSGKYEWLKAQGVKRVFVCGIDNALVKIADPLFVGFSIQSGAPIACKSTYKRSPEEKAGVFCFKNGKPSYVEYTEITEEQAKATDADGQYLYGDIGIVMYLFHMDILDKIASVPLPYHVAKKKCSYVTPKGELIQPTTPNSIKFETFIFDCFQMVGEVAVMRVLRDEEFAPIKNKAGEDSPETALALYENQYHQ